ncbi:hypothetical protein H4219_001422 [Mycoemilia scoparia]|uniref:Uncharacterized protein n=1 Tax=Mycoemilia scoparia TaxID=417184 RepID=A0A9W8A4U4_9FUNG|nr:hypothetical protein H4219_001422 [Mycoemilia scoparia]
MTISGEHENNGRGSEEGVKEAQTVPSPQQAPSSVASTTSAVIKSPSSYNATYFENDSEVKVQDTANITSTPACTTTTTTTTTTTAAITNGQLPELEKRYSEGSSLDKSDSAIDKSENNSIVNGYSETFGLTHRKSYSVSRIDLKDIFRDDDRRHSHFSHHNPKEPLKPFPDMPLPENKRRKESLVKMGKAAAKSSSNRQRSTIKDLVFGQLKDETSIIESDPNIQIKWERVLNYIQIPFQIENLMTFGMLTCLDTLLHTMTIVPLQMVIAIFLMMINAVFKVFGLFKVNTNPKVAQYFKLKPAHIYTAMKGALLIITCFLLGSVDTAKLYHSIRGQNTIKLAVIFGALDVTDRLCASLGLDIISSMYLTVISTIFTRSERIKKRKVVAKWSRFAWHFILALGYMLIHTMIIYYQMITWNVAVNSYGQQLLTLLISNQFVEIKGTVFKRWEKENLFQLSCADIVERFQLLIFLIIISGHNSLELISSSSSTLSALFQGQSQSPTQTFAGGASTATGSSILPNSATFPTIPQDFPKQEPTDYGSTVPSAFSALSSPFLTPMFNHLVAPVLIIYGSELIIDWLKHAFITKLNWIRPQVYTHYRNILCQELVKTQSPLHTPQHRRHHSDRGGSSNDDGEYSGYIGHRRSSGVKHSLKASRRMGFMSLPLVCVIFRVCAQSVRSGLGQVIGTNLTNSIQKMVCDMIVPCRYIPFGSQILKLTRFLNEIWLVVCIATIYIVLLVFKLFLGITLVRFAQKQSQVHDDMIKSKPSVSNSNSDKDNENKKYYTDYKGLETLERKKLLSLVTDPNDAEWEARRPKWSLETVERYELFKSRIP